MKAHPHPVVAHSESNTTTLGRRVIVRALLLTTASLLAVAPILGAADDEAPGAARSVPGGWFPSSSFYPRYIADPMRAQNALSFQWLADTEVPETGTARMALRLGGSFGIYRWSKEGQADLGWQLSFEGGFAGQFDLTESWDNTGWDGFYGLCLAKMVSPTFGFRVGTQHNSSHLGDEYILRTGIQRIHYTREEVIAGAAWTFMPRWTAYSELGLGNGIAGSLTWRLQSGVQTVSKQRYWHGRASHFVGLDVRTYEETDWSTRVTAQAGYWIPVGNRSAVHRIVVELGTGRSVMGQFLWDNETWLGIGWYFDF